MAGSRGTVAGRPRQGRVAIMRHTKICEARQLESGCGVTHERSLEQTKAGLRIKAPKTKHGRRTIILPDFLVADLHAHRQAQHQQRLTLGLGKMADDALVFGHVDGSPRRPDGLTQEWRRARGELGLKVSLHAFRHTHASALIASGMDILTISRRLGHSSPTITLAVYGPLFANNDDRAAQIVQSAFSARTE